MFAYCCPRNESLLLSPLGCRLLLPDCSSSFSTCKTNMMVMIKAMRATIVVMIKAKRTMMVINKTIKTTLKATSTMFLANLHLLRAPPAVSSSTWFTWRLSSFPKLSFFLSSSFSSCSGSLPVTRRKSLFITEQWISDITQHILLSPRSWEDACCSWLSTLLEL